MAIMAITTAKNNAELIEQCASLGYLNLTDVVLDPTYGLGRFWTNWKPEQLCASDINELRSPCGRAVDFRDLPWHVELFDAVVFDPPFKLNGTSTGAGPSSSDEDYGVDEYMRWQDRMQPKLPDTVQLRSYRTSIY